MKPHPRISRKTVKWGGAAVTPLVVVWIGSGWWVTAWSSDSGRGVAFEVGYVVFYHTPPIPNRNFFLAHVPPNAPYHWGWRFILKENAQKWEMFVPLWLPFLLLVPVTIAAWRLDFLARRHERARQNLCPKCHYDRTGLPPNSNCPECGTPPANP